MLVLNVVLVASLLIVGLAAHSLGVVAEGVDYLTDTATIAVSLIALWLSGRAPTARRPQGYPKAHAFAALVNAGWLLALTLAVTAGSIVRLATGTHHVHGLPVLVVSAIAAAFMLIGALILSGDDDRHGDDHGELNMKAVLLDTTVDAVTAAGVAATGAVILVTGGLYWLDPLVALVVSLVVAYHAARLLQRVAPALQ